MVLRPPFELNLLILCSQDLLEDSDDAHEEEIEDSFAEEANIIQNPFLRELPPLVLPDEASRPQGHGNFDSNSLDLGSLVRMRYQHQTEHAAKAVRTKIANSTADVDSDIQDGKHAEASVKQQLIREFHAIIREQQGQGLTTGLERGTRWGLSTPPAAGNAANAAAAASRVAKTVSLLSFVDSYSLLSSGSYSSKKCVRKGAVALPERHWGGSHQCSKPFAE